MKLKKSLLILKKQNHLHTQSPECNHLISMLVSEAKKIFTHVDVVVNGENISLTTDFILAIGTENVFISAQSLHIMCNFDKGKNIALPSEINNFSQDISLYTLRNYEKNEQLILKKKLKPLTLPNSHLPVALFSTEFFEKVGFCEDIFENENLLQTLDSTQNISYEGIYFRFADYYGSAREDILPYIPTTTNRLHILEIGCALALTGKLLEEKRNCTVTGIEMQKEIAQEAQKNISKVIVGDIEKVRLEQLYDIIIATDVVEHLQYPKELLSHLHSHLTTKGKIILSIPNIGHYSIVEDLLVGRWDYVPMGILCYTHFRFFTRSTLEQLFANLPFSSCDIIPVKTSLPKHIDKLAKKIEIDKESLATSSFYIILEK